MGTYTITLMDGRELPCVMKAEQPETVYEDVMKLDTTGEYLKFGRRKTKVPEEDVLQRAAWQYNHYILTKYAWYFLENAEKILSDSKMFLAPVKVQNGLAYMGTGGFMRPTLGVYLEWWLHCSDASRDVNGDLVWYISGSPLTGSHCCAVVTPVGKEKRMSEPVPFGKVYKTFMDVNTRYTEAKQRCEAYSLEEVLIRLKGEDYKYRLIDFQHEIIQMVMDWDRKSIEREYSWLKTKYKKLVFDNKRIQLEHYRSIIFEFYEKYLERQQRVKELETEYVAEHRALKQRLHSGTLQRDYHRLLAEASREYKAKKREQSELFNQFIKDTFGRNPNQITPSDILLFAKGKPLKIESIV